MLAAREERRVGRSLGRGQRGCIECEGERGRESQRGSIISIRVMNWKLQENVNLQSVIGACMTFQVPTVLVLFFGFDDVIGMNRRL